MISYKDREFCASTNCTPRCARHIGKSERDNAAKLGHLIAWGYHCGDEHTAITTTTTRDKR